MKANTMTIDDKQKSKIFYYFPFYNSDLVTQIKYDDTALYSITKQEIADSMTNILKNMPRITAESPILDATACVGGNTLSFCKFFKNVTAIELDEARYGYLRNNVELFGYNEHTVTLINCNCINFIRNLENHVKYDIMFFDPPWGGPEYKNHRRIMLYLQEISMIHLLDIVRGKTQYCVIKVPLNFDFKAIKEAIYNMSASYRIYYFNKMAMITIKL